MYDLADLLGTNDKHYPTIAYARVSSGDQKEDLERQHAVLEAFCNKNVGGQKSLGTSAVA
jgi:predicted site-specific integrase-resolvase